MSPDITSWSREWLSRARRPGTTRCGRGASHASAPSVATETLEFLHLRRDDHLLTRAHCRASIHLRVRLAFGESAAPPVGSHDMLDLPVAGRGLRDRLFGRLLVAILIFMAVSEVAVDAAVLPSTQHPGSRSRDRLIRVAQALAPGIWTRQSLRSCVPAMKNRSVCAAPAETRQGR